MFHVEVRIKIVVEGAGHLGRFFVLQGSDLTPALPGSCYAQAGIPRFRWPSMRKAPAGVTVKGS